MSAHSTPHQIQFLRMTPLRGPNIWTYRPVIEALIDIGDLEDCPSNTLPGFAERLTAWLPGLVEHRCSVGERGGFLKRLEEGTWPGHILEHMALELQTRAGMQTGFGKAREAGPRGVYKVVIRTRHEAVSRQALLSARDLVLAAIADQPFDLASHIAQLTQMVDSLCIGPSTASIVDAAADRGIPSIRLNDGNHARGVSLELSRQEDIEAAYGIALAEGSEVIVERFILGEEHRLLVVGDQVVAVNKGETASVVGDGLHTVQQLIELQINSDPRRGEEEDFPLDTIRLEDHTTSVLELKRQGLSAGSVPEAGRSVLIMRTGNMSMDVTDLVHPDVAAQAVLAARVVGLDIAGVDLVVQDISKPLGPQGGAVVEVNAGPGLLMHLKPATGQPRPVGQAIANHLFTPEDNGRIPVVGLMGDGDTTRAAQLLAWLLHLKGLHTGLSCANGLFLNQRQLPTQDGMDWAQAQRLLINRGVQAAVFESDARHLLAQGLPYDRCQIGIVTRMPRATGLDDLYPGGDEKMPGYIRTQIDVVLPEGTAVLNAADPEVAALADYCDGSVMFYADDEHNTRLQAHRSAGHRVGFWREGQLLLAQGPKEHLVLSSQRPAVARLLKAGSLNTHDMLVAACAAWALDIGTDLIRAGIKSYGSLPTA